MYMGDCEFVYKETKSRMLLCIHTFVTNEKREEKKSLIHSIMVYIYLIVDRIF